MDKQEEILEKLKEIQTALLFFSSILGGIAVLLIGCAWQLKVFFWQ